MSGDATQSAGTRLFIATTSAVCATKAEFEALTFVEIEEIEDIGSFGATAAKVSYKSLSGGTMRKKKGTVDYGSCTVKLARIPAATGQAAAKAAVKDRAHAYAVKIQHDDAPDATGTGSGQYFMAFWMSYTTEIGDADKVVEASVNLEIDSEPVEFAAVAGA